MIVDAMKPAEESTTSNSTSPAPTSPRGKCRAAVRGFAASIVRSTSRLKAIAAVRAVTMQRRMPAATRAMPMGEPPARSPSPPQRIAISAAIAANGRAKSVWLNRTSSR